MPSVTEQILRSRMARPPIDQSRYFAVTPDLVLGHEATIALLIDRLKASGRSVARPESCFFAADHFVPPATSERADILRRYLDFIRAEGISEDHLFEGISHQLMVEDRRCRPEAVIAGADSHTTMAGALGCFAAGFGSTDILGLLATGHVWVQIPEAIEVRFTGHLRPHVTGKDVALEMMRQLGEGGAGYRSIEFYDEDQALTMASRMTLTNMAVDCGAKNGLFFPDEVTWGFMEARDGRRPEGMSLSPGSGYPHSLLINLSDLEPVVARPGSPADVVPVSATQAEAVDQVFIGSCCGGRLEDLHQAAEILQGRRIPRSLRLVVTPASRKVYQAALLDGTVATLIAAGAMVTTPSCGACGGIDKGILGKEEVCISTSNRNFRGRMGDNSARIYLSSAATAAATALAGVITDPRQVESC